jgi:hypothetical protein
MWQTTVISLPILDLGVVEWVSILSPSSNCISLPLVPPPAAISYMTQGAPISRHVIYLTKKDTI